MLYFERDAVTANSKPIRLARQKNYVAARTRNALRRESIVAAISETIINGVTPYITLTINSLSELIPRHAK